MSPPVEVLVGCMSFKSTYRCTWQLLAFSILSRRIDMQFASDCHNALSMLIGMLWQPYAKCAVVVQMLGLRVPIWVLYLRFDDP